MKVISIMDKLNKFNHKNQWYKILDMELEDSLKKMNMNMLEFLSKI